jgi:hypothetical protein
VCAGVAAICKIASIEDNHLETDEGSTSGGMGATNLHEVLQDPCEVCELLHGSHSTASIMAHWLMTV